MEKGKKQKFNVFRKLPNLMLGFPAKSSTIWKHINEKQYNFSLENFFSSTPVTEIYAYQALLLLTTSSENPSIFELNAINKVRNTILDNLRTLHSIVVTLQPNFRTAKG